ncbi:hypothetical protein [Candidatus Enterococcus mangumiae]|uniref:hypothetical protein n=1 Tax=Candidatus Enterococcus mangumiae TaxID=2230878 RepID=UPI001A8C9FD7|nr:hypothetical protein [Enterococcus sp. DIV1094]MBO0489433.1 hypothetical protein [Enterococcus sp. DIV1094]
MTIAEYETRIIAYRLKRLDEQELIHYQAWANRQVKATKKRGKYEVPLFDTFEKFFNKEKLENKILGKDEKTPRFVNS